MGDDMLEQGPESFPIDHEEQLGQLGLSPEARSGNFKEQSHRDVLDWHLNAGGTKRVPAVILLKRCTALKQLTQK